MTFTEKDGLKRRVKQLDGALQRATDYAVDFWRVLYPTYPQPADMALQLALDVEMLRYRIRQLYLLLWGGAPEWLVTLPDVSDAVRTRRLGHLEGGD